MTRYLSQKIRFFTFICIALLAYVHGYNLRESYLTPYSTVNEPLTFTSFFEFLFANGLLRFRIPLLFMISGYLYAMYDHRPYLEQVKNRFRKLIIPFVLWSALGLLLTFVLQQFPYTAKLVSDTQIDQLNDNRPYTQIGWKGVLHRWLAAPVCYQLWFLTTLFTFNFIYPVIRWLVVKVPYIWLPLTFIYFMFFVYFPLIDSRGLVFFSLGVWMQKKNFSIEDQPKWFSLGLTIILFLGLSVVKTFMAFELDPYTYRQETNASYTDILLTLLHQLSVITGIMAMWFGSDRVIDWFYRQRWFQRVNGLSFFIFGLHVPLLPYTMTLALGSLSFLPYCRIICYLFVPLLVLLVCIWLAHTCRNNLPRVYKVLTGGRGF